jgi:hypothetical protein
VSEQKALERLFLHEVAAIYQDFPSGTIANIERPDFLISGESRVTEIEVVRYMRGHDSGGSDYRRNEILWQQLADEARREFESNHSAPVMVHFLWHSDRNPGKADVPRMALSAAKIIAEYMPQNIFESTRIAGNESVGTPLHAFVSSIHVMRVRSRRLASWSSIDAGFRSVSTNELQQLTASKNIKVPEYLQRCDEVWLLLVADRSYISSTAELSAEEVSQAYFPSLFQKVLFYVRSNRRITALTG